MLRLWLERHPYAVVSAIGPDGQPVPTPAELPLLPTHEVDGRSLLALVAPEEATKVVGAFRDALRHGLSAITVELADGGTVRLHYADVRADYGVLLRMVLPGGDDEPDAAADGKPVDTRLPRLAVIEKDDISTIRGIDAATSALLGWSAEDMVGHPTLEFIHPDDQPRAIDNWMEMIALGVRHAVRVRFRTKDDRWLWVETSNEIRYTTSGERWVRGQLIDISEEMAATEALRYNEAVLRRMAETVPVGLLELSRDREVRYLNSSLGALLAEHKIDSLDALVDGLGSHDRVAFEQALTGALAEGIDSDVDIRLPGAGAAPDRLCRVAVRSLTDGPDVLGALLCVMDVTDLKLRAATDPLTGLHNRASVFDTLQTALASSDPVGVFFVDLDQFKSVNDEFGHDVGDHLLCDVAAVLRNGVRADDVVGRLGGDEFVVVCPNAASPESCLEVAERLQAAVRDHVEAEGLQMCSGASVGVAWIAETSVTADEAVARADSAMYAAKQGTHCGPVLWKAPAPIAS
ncbi:MAG TPA: sensor domain-containing diguanylate cyclase [Acidimicrobiales bacterium]|nr:sensor domain-containing diguanylate cyclase [Acidimicrobiales bacterium]